MDRLRTVSSHAVYGVPHGTLQFLLAVPIALIPALRNDARLGVSGKAIDLAISAGTASNALGKVVNGIVVDQIGASLFAKAALLVGSGSLALLSAWRMKLVLFAGFMFLQFAASGGWLIGCRVIHDVFPKRRWGLCFAILSASSRAASMLCKLVMGAALDFLTWRQIALAGAVVGASLCVVVAHLFAWAASRRRRRGVVREDLVVVAATTEEELSRRSEFLPGSRRRTTGEDDDDLPLGDPLDDDDGAAIGGSVVVVEAETGGVSATLAKILKLLFSPGLFLYGLVMAGATCVSAFDSQVPILLGDMTAMSDAHVSMSATVFPAALLLSVLVAPSLIERLERRRPRGTTTTTTTKGGGGGGVEESLLVVPAGTTPNADSRPRRRPTLLTPTLLLELGLLGISLVSALTLAALASTPEKRPPGIVLLCVAGVAFGISVTFYITPNIYALEFGGKDCATASAILDTVGLVASSLWALVAAAVKGGNGKYRAWHLTMVLLAVIIVATAALSVAALAVAQREQRRRDDLGCAASQDHHHHHHDDDDARNHKPRRRPSLESTSDDLSLHTATDDDDDDRAYPGVVVPPFHHRGDATTKGASRIVAADDPRHRHTTR